jgi:hypothetical protein
MAHRDCEDASLLIGPAARFGAASSRGETKGRAWISSNTGKRGTMGGVDIWPDELQRQSTSFEKNRTSKHHDQD